jgi:bacterioferritin B
MPAERFIEGLNEQIGDEFAAHQQYVAIAAHYESQTLPRLAGFFYAQAVEERNHAMMMVKYLLDTSSSVRIPGVEGPVAEFGDVVAPIKLALDQERSVSGRLSRLFEVAREERDYLSEQFMQWFLREQIEEEATMSELLDVAERSRDLPMMIEEYIAREQPGGAEPGGAAPPVAGGAL